MVFSYIERLLASTWIMFRLPFRVVGGIDVLGIMESIETDKNDKPNVCVIKSLPLKKIY